MTTIKLRLYREWVSWTKRRLELWSRFKKVGWMLNANIKTRVGCRGTGRISRRRELPTFLIMKKYKCKNKANFFIKNNIFMFCSTWICTLYSNFLQNLLCFYILFLYNWKCWQLMPPWYYPGSLTPGSCFHTYKI